MKKFSWSAGHSKTTPGKQSPDGYKEWQYTSEIVKYAMAELANYEDVAQLRIDDPTGNRDIPLQERSDRINAWGSNCHIDVHLNAIGTSWGTHGGTETYAHSSQPKESTELAKIIQNNLVRELGFRNRGVKYANFHMLREVKATAVLPEIAFMDNKTEAYAMRKAENQKKAAKAIVDALVSFYGLKRKPQGHSFFFTGGYEGQALSDIHKFLKDNQFGYTPIRHKTGLLMFDVGGFPVGSEAEEKFESFLKKRGFAHEKRVK